MHHRDVDLAHNRRVVIEVRAGDELQVAHGHIVGTKITHTRKSATGYKDMVYLAARPFM